VAEWKLNGPGQEIWTRAEVIAYLRISARGLDRLISEGLFPRGMPGGRGLIWTGLDVSAYLYMRGRCRKGPPDRDDDEGEEEPAP
jgi:predicted DNA-binding transcriptional regulator AlpA